MKADRSLTKALLAGAAGGFAGSAAQILAEAVAPSRSTSQIAPPAVRLEHATGSRLSANGKVAATQAVHWPFGIAIGAMYGVIAEYFPQVTNRGGADFGVALWGLAHQAALPALRLSPSPSPPAVYERGNELSTHAIFGLVTEVTRRWVRGLLR